MIQIEKADPLSADSQALIEKLLRARADNRQQRQTFF
jgi:hypothetical protein